MAKTFDFNRLKQPVLPLTLADEKKTKLELMIPDTALAEELEAMLPHLKELTDADDAEAIKAVYGLAAKLISCNAQGMRVTAEDLRDKYGIKLQFMPAFYGAYLEFIEDATKN